MGKESTPRKRAAVIAECDTHRPRGALKDIRKKKAQQDDAGIVSIDLIAEAGVSG